MFRSAIGGECGILLCKYCVGIFHLLWAGGLAKAFDVLYATADDFYYSVLGREVLCDESVMYNLSSDKYSNSGTKSVVVLAPHLIRHTIMRSVFYIGSDRHFTHTSTAEIFWKTLLLSTKSQLNQIKQRSCPVNHNNSSKQDLNHTILPEFFDNVFQGCF